MTVYSLEAQVTLVLAIPVDKIAETRYVKGDTLYIQIQKPGMLLGEAKIPQKNRHIMKTTLARLPPASAVSVMAMHMWAKVHVKTRNCQKRSHMRAPLSAV